MEVGIVAPSERFTVVEEVRPFRVADPQVQQRLSVVKVGVFSLGRGSWADLHSEECTSLSNVVQKGVEFRGGGDLDAWVTSVLQVKIIRPALPFRCR